MKSRRTAPTRSAVAVGDVLGDVLKRVDPEQQLRAYGIWSFWNDEVGSGIARHAQPARFRNGILFVTVATHSWMQELQFMKDSIRDRLNGRLGASLVRDIFFVSGHVDVDAAAPAAAPPAGLPPSTAPSAAATGSPIALPPIADQELAAAFTRIVEAHARRGARPATTPARPARAKRPR